MLRREQHISLGRFRQNKLSSTWSRVRLNQKNRFFSGTLECNNNEFLKFPLFWKRNFRKFGSMKNAPGFLTSLCWMRYCSVRPKYSTTKTWNIFSKSVTTLSFISSPLSQGLCQQEGNGTEIRWRILTPETKKKPNYESWTKQQ